MDIKYYKEQQHNYMVIHKTEDDKNIGYQTKMLSSRKMKYLLDTSLRSIDGQDYSYYDISSKLSLNQLYGSRNMDMTDINRLMKDIRAVCLELDQYLLDTNRLALNPEFIFFSYSESQYYFLYNISTDVAECRDGFAKLMDFLLERVNTSDETAMNLVYQLYEYYERGNFDIWDAIEMVSQDASEESYLKDEKGIEDLDGSAIQEIESSPWETNLDYIQNLDASACTESHVKNKHQLVLHIILIVIGIIGLSACIALYFLVVLTDRELLLLYGGAFTAVLMVIAGISLLVLGIKRERNLIVKDKEFEEYIADELKALDVNRLRNIHMDDFMVQSSRVSWDKKNKGLDNQEQINEEHTVFFEPDMENGNYRLFAIDKKNKQHISLEKFPCTIGKMSEYVDCCIDHPTISRLHARIDKKDNKLMIADLNSTNGVYLNGIRLNPNEERWIDEGDEIRFGGLNYCLRYT